MQLKIEKGTFTNHSLEDIASALKKGLSENFKICLLYTSPSPRDVEESRMPSSA